MLRPYLLQVIRSLGLSHLLDRGRYLYNKVRMRAANQQFKANNPDFVLPPDYLVYESFRLDYAAYKRTGKTAAQWIKEHFATHQQQLNKLSILDWGCGPGRVLRHLPEVFGDDGDYHGADPNERSVHWCQSNLPKVSVSQSQLNPPLPYTDQQFDLLYGISIFTHLSASAHDSWMKELMRVLKPGGMALITTHGPAYRVKLTKSEQVIYDADNWVIRGGVDEGHRVYTAYHPPQRFRELVAPFAEVLTYVAGQPTSWGIEQDTWVIRKR